MQAIDRLTRGNTYCGPCNYKSAIQLPTKLREDIGPGMCCAVIGLTIRIGLSYVVDHTFPLHLAFLYLAYRLLFLIAFGVHFCTRFSLMDDEARDRALKLYLFVGIPLTFLPAQFALIALLRPRWCLRALGDWFTYPQTFNPGLYRSPIPLGIRYLLSLSFDFHMALIAMLPASFAVNKDEVPSFKKLFAALQRSPHWHERESVLIGLNEHDGAPHLEHYTAFLEHIGIIGRTKSGKTAFMACLHYQLSIILPLVAQIIIDCKSHSNELLAGQLATGKPTKWFTFQTGLSSYVMNPLDQTWYLKRAAILRNAFWTAAINLDSGPDHGRQWFSIAGVVNLIRPSQREPKTLREMAKIMEHGGGMKDEIRKAGSYVRAVFQYLQHVDAINAPSTMQMEEEIEAGNNLYFGLPALESSILTRYTGSMALQSVIRSVFTADPDKFKGFVFADEAQTIGGRNTESLFTQARSVGLSLITSMQLGANAEGQVSDLGETIENNVGIEFIFSAKTKDEIERVKTIGGETVEALFSEEIKKRPVPYFTWKRPWGSNSNGASYYATTKYKLANVNVSQMREVLASRYPTNEINRISINPQLCIIRTQNENYLGACNTVRTFYHIDKRTYEKRRSMPWPAGNEHTITLTNEPPKEDITPPPDEPPPIHTARKKPRK